MAQNWVRIYRDRLKERNRFGVVSAWWGAFWNSPSMAIRAKYGYLKQGKTSEVRSKGDMETDGLGSSFRIG